MEKEYRTAMFRNSPLIFTIFLILSPVGIGLICFLIWWLKCKSISLTVDADKSVLRIGLLSKNTIEIWHEDIRQVKISQSFSQRLFGVGDISISSAAGDGDEISIVGVRSPEEIKDVIDAGRRDED